MQVLNYIGGEWKSPLNGKFMDNINPATGEVYGTIPESDEQDVALAVEAAQKALDAWRNTSPEYRSQLLFKIADLIDAKHEELALAETTDNGKPLNVSKVMDIPRASANFRYFASAAVTFGSESYEMSDGMNVVLRQPIGIVGCISPWNLPLYLFTWKIAPALATGNCVIAKPSEVTPVTAYLLSQICHEAGLPAGVLNIIHGTGPSCGSAIVSHPNIKAISFTGSTRAGADIAAIAAPKFKKISLELGGKNPTIIFDDCDWDIMMKTVLLSSFSNQGQICLCGSRILIQDTIYDKFKEEFVAKTSQLKVGDPLERESRIGAIVSKAHFDKINFCIQRAKNEGGTILVGGTAVQLEGRCKNGFFIQPTVIEGLGPKAATNQEEIFGPVVTLQKFHTKEEALQLANDTTYGLSASVWTNNMSTSQYISKHLEAGIIWINTWLKRDLRTPFGGMKNSGVGREGGWDAMRFFTEPKNICTEHKF